LLAKQNSIYISDAFQYSQKVGKNRAYHGTELEQGRAVGRTEKVHAFDDH
jgi:hypothetical protein